MKYFALIALLLTASVVDAKPREWKDATVIAITSGQSGAAVVPVGGALYGARINQTYYWIKTDDITYVVMFDTWSKSHALNVTLHGKTKISVDGRKAHILDDSGKDVTYPIVQKVAN